MTLKLSSRAALLLPSTTTEDRVRDRCRWRNRRYWITISVSDDLTLLFFFSFSRYLSNLPSLDISDSFPVENRRHEPIRRCQTLAGHCIEGRHKILIFKDCGPDCEGRAGRTVESSIRPSAMRSVHNLVTFFCTFLCRTIEGATDKRAVHAWRSFLFCEIRKPRWRPPDAKS